MADVNGFDLAVGLVAFGAALGGYRLGLITRVVSWVGLAVGFVLAVRAVPRLLEYVQGWDHTWLLIATLAVVLFGASVGQSVGFAVGARVRPVVDGVARADRLAGSVAGVVGVILMVWLLLPLLIDTPGAVAEQARASTLAQEIDGRLPDPPDSMEALRAVIGKDDSPRVFDALRPTPDLGPAPGDSGLSAGTVVGASRSVVKIEGIACNRVQDGTGFVVANDLVATNAHVVAGERQTEIVRDDGARLSATVVAFDPNRDLAVLRVPGLGRERLPIAESTLDATGGVFGHPGGGDLEISPFAVARSLKAVGRDIYGSQVTSRDVLELRSSLRPGDSGSALIDTNGSVVGVAFAIAPDKPDVASALSTTELRAVLAGDLSAQVGTGRCTTG